MWKSWTKRSFSTLTLLVVFQSLFFTVLLRMYFHNKRPWPQQGAADPLRFICARVPGELPPCPERPPGLVGPLRVNCLYKWSLAEVRRRMDVPLGGGGRYRPPDGVSRHEVAVVIPFRHRHEHLNHWLHHLIPILARQQLDYGIYVINQHGGGIFNRAKLMNAGYVEALKEDCYDGFVFSDVDLFPMDDRNLYRCFGSPRHLTVAVDKFHYRLLYSTMLGGVISLSRDQFLKINRFPNTYWGWGGEDDDISLRVRSRQMSISRPDPLKGKFKMIPHERDLHNELNPVNRGKFQPAHLNMDTDGLHTLDYRVVDIVRDELFTNITVDVGVPPAGQFIYTVAAQ